MRYLKNIVLLSILSSITSLTPILLFLDNIYAQQFNLSDNKFAKGPEFFALQHALSGSITESNKSSYTLELNNISDKMILFSNEPDRLVKSIGTDDFINKLIEETNGLQSSQANVELVLDLKDGQKSFVVELSNPEYQKQNKLLKYDILLNESKSGLQTQFGEVTLVIDSISIDPRHISKDPNLFNIENKTTKNHD